MSQRRTNNKQTSNTRQTDSDKSILQSTAAEWGGDQVSRAAWFNTKLKHAADTFEFKTLCLYGTVPTSRGKTAVFSAEHAMEHLQKVNIGS